MLVFAFDRDWTVDVNPHPHRDAVPLEWVRTLAHETEHAVYAIGNQQLAAGADVPGVVDVVDRHPDDREEWLGEQQADGRYERFPSRRERLALVADLHPEADGYVVVDDIDLSDVSGWDHYHAWEFVPAVREGRIDPSLPWCERRLADGGYPTVAGVVPFSVDVLRDFLAEHEDAAAFQLRYEDDDPDRVVADIHIDEPAIGRPAPAVLLECTALPPGRGTIRVRLDDVRMVSVVEPPDDLFTVEGETPRERAAALADLARVAPDRVSVPPLLDLLESEDAAIRDDALDALADTVETRPADCLPALPRLRELTAGAGHRADALAVLASIAEARPGDVAPFADEVAAHLDADDDDVGRAAARCISAVADHDATDVLDAVPSLVLLVEGREAGFEHALYALNRIAAEYPAEVRPAAPALATVLSAPSLDATARLNATAALGRVASEYPDAGVQAVDTLCELLDADDQRVRANAAGVLSDVATHHADVLVPHVDVLAPLLESDDDYALVNTTAALSRVAETDRDAVEHLTDRFVSLLGHDHDLVRLNACWGLGHLRASEATDRLDDVRTTDDDDRVRNRAAWAIAKIERYTDRNSQP